MKAFALGLLLTIGVTQSAPVIKSGMPTQTDVALAVARIPRFPPDRFPSLPPSVRQAFGSINCQVPQPNLTGGPSNVIDGEFAAKGQRDWAALCSDGSTSQIRVVWGGSATCDDRLAPRQDSDVMTVVSPGVVAFDRVLRVATVEHLQRYLQRHQEVLPDGPTHDAIEDASGNVSLVYYCHAGRWLRIPGGS